MRPYLIPFAPVRVDRERCLTHAKVCFEFHRAGYPSAEALMWEWLLRWAGATL